MKSSSSTCSGLNPIHSKFCGLRAIGPPYPRSSLNPLVSTRCLSSPMHCRLGAADLVAEERSRCHGRHVCRRRTPRPVTELRDLASRAEGRLHSRRVSQLTRTNRLARRPFRDGVTNLRSPRGKLSSSGANPSSVVYMTDEEKSPRHACLQPRTERREHGEPAVHLHTKHGWTVGRQLMNEFEAQGVEVQFGGYAQDVTHTMINKNKRVCPRFG